MPHRGDCVGYAMEPTGRPLTLSRPLATLNKVKWNVPVCRAMSAACGKRSGAVTSPP